MLKQQAFKFRLVPDEDQARAMICYVGMCRFVFNKGLEHQKDNYRAGGKFISYKNITLLLPKWKKDFPWLKDAPSQALQQALKNLDNAYQRFFEKKSDFPRFKKRGKRSSFRIPQGFEIDAVNHRIKIPKIGWMKLRNHRPIEGNAKSLSFSFDAGHWYVSIQTEAEVADPVCTLENPIGIDLGITRFATLNDGSFYEPLSSFKKNSSKLKRAQQDLSRRVVKSNNWLKALRRVQKIHKHIKNSRLNYLHKISSDISKNHAVVVIEDLKVSNMSRSAKGTLAEPGKNVRAKSGMNRSILDQGWSEFRRQLDYKLKWNGGRLIVVPPQYTSQTCPILTCGHVSKENRKTQARFACVKCGYENNADFVGALNVLARGHRVTACGEAGSGSMQKHTEQPILLKQEPAFAIQQA